MSVQNDIDKIRRHQDLVVRAKQSVMLMEELQNAIAELSEIRAAALRDLHNTGWSYAQLGEAVGLTRARVHQIVDR